MAYDSLSCTVRTTMPKLSLRSARGRGAAALATALLLTATLPAASTPAQAAAGDKTWQARAVGNAQVKDRDRKLVAKLPASTKLGYHPQTGRVRLISGTPAKPLASGVVGVASGERRLALAEAKGRARDFMRRYGKLFGLKRAGSELRVSGAARRLEVSGGARLSAVADGRNAVVRFDQVRDGVPVMGGQVVVQLSAGGEVVSAAGEVLPTASRAAAAAALGSRVSSSRARTAVSYTHLTLPTTLCMCSSRWWPYH